MANNASPPVTCGIATENQCRSVKRAWILESAKVQVLAVLFHFECPGASWCSFAIRAEPVKQWFIHREVTMRIKEKNKCSASRTETGLLIDTWVEVRRSPLETRLSHGPPPMIWRPRLPFSLWLSLLPLSPSFLSPFLPDDSLNSCWVQNAFFPYFSLSPTQGTKGIAGGT